MDENLWLIVWRKKSTDFVSIHIVWNPAKGSPFLKCVVSIRALPVRVGWGVCVWRLARMVWGIFTPPLPVDGLGHFFFHICPFDRGGVGLKLFGQCPYRTNIFQKGPSKLSFLPSFESFDTTLGPICACLSPWWISVIPLSTLTTDVSISLMRPRHRTNIAAPFWPDLFQTA